jgi:hypothetical protein
MSLAKRHLHPKFDMNSGIAGMQDPGQQGGA